jgi:hypothetical protein
VFLTLNGCTAWEGMTGFISLDSCPEEIAGNLKLQQLCTAISSGPAKVRTFESDQHSYRNPPCRICPGFFKAEPFVCKVSDERKAVFIGNII